MSGTNGTVIRVREHLPGTAQNDVTTIPLVVVLLLDKIDDDEEDEDDGIQLAAV